MAPQLGFLWLCTLLWGCSSLAPQKGYRTSRGYYPYERPPTSGLHYPEVPVNSNHNNEMQARRRESYVPPQRQPVRYATSETGNPIAGIREERVQRQPNSGYGFSGPSTPSAERYKHSSSHTNPFNLLVKQHVQNHVHGISFPTVNQFQHFIDAMKSSYLTPGSDSSRYFQTARETIKNVGESSMGYNDYAEQHDDVNSNWHGHGASYQTPDNPSSIPEPVESSAALDSSNGDTNPESSQDYMYPPPPTILAGHGSTDLGYPGENKDTSTNVPMNQQRKMNYLRPGSFSDEDSSPGNPEYASSVKLSYSQNQDFNPYQSMPRAHPPPMNQKYDIKDSVSRPPTPIGDYVRGKGFQRGSPNVSPQNSFLEENDQSLHAPRVQIYRPTQKQRPNPRPQVHYPTNGIKTQNVAFNYFQPAVPSRSNHGPLGTKGRVAFQTHHQSVAFNPKQSESSYLNPSSTDQDSSQPDYLEYQRDGPNVFNSVTRTKKEENMDEIGSYETINPQRSSASQRNFSIDSSVSAGLQSNENRIPSRMTKRFKNQAYWPFDQQSAPKGCVVWTDGGKTNDPLSENTQLTNREMLKNRNRFARNTAYLSKTCHTQFQQSLNKAKKESWKVASPRRKVSKMSNPDMQMDRIFSSETLPGHTAESESMQI